MVPSSIKCNKCNLLTESKKQKQKKQETRKKKQYLHNLDRTSEEILKVRIQKFLGCRGYLHKANHCVKGHWKMLLQKRYRVSSPTAPILSLPAAIFNN